jgi:hypothetical protein
MTYYSIIKRVAVGGVAIVGLAAFGVTVARAQSSGNFAAQILTTQCTINTAGGLPNSGSLDNHGGGTMLKTYIKTPNSQYTTLLITPSLVTGLFTNTEVTQDMTSSAQTAAVVVNVTLDGNVVSPETATSPEVIYDQRFQQLSVDAFSHIAECSMANNCTADLVLSTLGAHSFNFVAPNVGGGVHQLQVDWRFECRDHTGTVVPCTSTYTANSAGACAGPGTVTVQQVKAFTQSGGVTIGQ